MKTISQFKNTLVGTNGRLGIIEEKINGLQNEAIESIKSKNNFKKLKQY